jgi:hypothetical protein
MQQKDSPAIFLLEDIEVHARAAFLARLHNHIQIQLKIRL